MKINLKTNTFFRKYTILFFSVLIVSLFFISDTKYIYAGNCSDVDECPSAGCPSGQHCQEEEICKDDTCCPGINGCVCGKIKRKKCVDNPAPVTTCPPCLKNPLALEPGMTCTNANHIQGTGIDYWQLTATSTCTYTVPTPYQGQYNWAGRNDACGAYRHRVYYIDNTTGWNTIRSWDGSAPNDLTLTFTGQELLTRCTAQGYSARELKVVATYYLYYGSGSGVTSCRSYTDHSFCANWSGLGQDGRQGCPTWNISPGSWSSYNTCIGQCCSYPNDVDFCEPAGYGSPSWGASAQIMCPAVCGNGSCEAGGGETCSNCPSDCGGCCGNGAINPGEECDDSNTTNGDGCSSTCQKPATCEAVCTIASGCTGYTCLAGTLKCRNSGCTGETDCNCNVCGDGDIDPGEECDDSNITNSDGCSSTCQKPDTCDAVCTVAIGCDGGLSCTTLPGEGAPIIHCRKASCIYQTNCNCCGNGTCGTGETCSNCSTDCPCPTCGSAHNQLYYTATIPPASSTLNSTLRGSTTLCGVGTSPDPSTTTSAWGWTCASNGSTITTCAATRTYCGDGTKNGSEECDSGDDNGTECNPAAGTSCTYCGTDCKIKKVNNPINGICGTATDNNYYNNTSPAILNSTTRGSATLCAAGTAPASDPSTTTGTWSWTCTGIGTGATDASCEAFRQYCSDGTKNGSEECDSGDDNGTECNPAAGTSCTYCGTDCKTKTVNNPIDGSCGSASSNSYYNNTSPALLNAATRGIATLCSAGTAPASDPSTTTGTWSWTCTGIGTGSTSASCSATRQYCSDGTKNGSEECDSGASNGTACNPAAGTSCTYCGTDCKTKTVNNPINGSCGTASSNSYYNNTSPALLNAATRGSATLCAAGTAPASDPSTTTGTWSWTCTGISTGATNASCSATRQYCGDSACNGSETCANCTDCPCTNGQCGSANTKTYYNTSSPAILNTTTRGTDTLCSAGATPSDPSTVTSAWSWVCAGTGTGATNASCSSTRQYCGDGTKNGTEACDSGGSNGTPCTPPVGGSCTYCTTSCTNQTVIGPVNGSCGTAHTKSYYNGNSPAILNTGTRGTDTLCSAGTAPASDPSTTTGTWSWTCSGTGGGTSASCNSTRLYCGDASCNGGENCATCASDCSCTNGSCGSANAKTYYNTNSTAILNTATRGTDTLCSSGTPPGTDPSTTTSTWSWLCYGIGSGSTNSSCNATRRYCGDSICSNGEDCVSCLSDCTCSNGQCGTANNQTFYNTSSPANLNAATLNTKTLCAAGTAPASDPSTTTGTWSWTCTGIGTGATNASCSATRQYCGDSACNGSETCANCTDCPCTNGQCGSANTKTYYNTSSPAILNTTTRGTDTLCSAGATPADPSTTTSAWSWICAGTGSGATNASCSSTRQYCGDGTKNGTEACDSGSGNGTPCTPPVGGSCTYCTTSCTNQTVIGPVNGSCGTAHTKSYYNGNSPAILNTGTRGTDTLCSAGTAPASDPSTTTGTWSWTCSGTGTGASNASCNANRLSCGDGTCSSGNGENCTNCKPDCGGCGKCGCEAGESCVTCPTDCACTNGQCGTSNTKTYYNTNSPAILDAVTRGSDTICSAGTPPASDPSTNTAAWSWVCTGTGTGATNATCASNRTYCGDNSKNGTEECDAGPNNGVSCTPPVGGSCTYCKVNCTIQTVIGPVNGACGTANTQTYYNSNSPAVLNVATRSSATLCAGGTPPASDPSTTTGTWSWVCTGTGTGAANATCTATRQYCGDGTKNSSEQCDDGNITGGDGCSATCTLPNTCNAICTSIIGCSAGYACVGGVCKNTSCTGESDCVCRHNECQNGTCARIIGLGIDQCSSNDGCSHRDCSGICTCSLHNHYPDQADVCGVANDCPSGCGQCIKCACWIRTGGPFADAESSEAPDTFAMNNSSGVVLGEKTTHVNDILSEKTAEIMNSIKKFINKILDY